jgi:hypothetical protein
LLIKSIIIYIFIADSFVNEIFGDKMIILKTEDVNRRFEPHFADKFAVMAEEFSFRPDSTGFQCVKPEIMTLFEAKREARVIGTEFPENNVWKGITGLLGAVLRSDRGIEAAGLYGEHF